MTEPQALWVLRLAGTAVLVLFLASVAVDPRAPVRLDTPGFHDPMIAFVHAALREAILTWLGAGGLRRLGRSSLQKPPAGVEPAPP